MAEEQKTKLTRDEAVQLTAEERKAGIVVEGKAPPFGGSWTYDEEADALTLAESPTEIGTPKQEEDNAG